MEQFGGNGIQFHFFLGRLLLNFELKKKFCCWKEFGCLTNVAIRHYLSGFRYFVFVTSSLSAPLTNKRHKENI